MSAPIYATGLVSIASGETTITQVGGVWTEPTIFAGDFIQFRSTGAVYCIDSITGINEAELTQPLVGASIVSDQYVIVRLSPRRLMSADVALRVTELLDRLNIAATGWMVGTGAPDDEDDGALGYIYIDDATGDLYGPKLMAGWPASTVNVRGPRGYTGWAPVFAVVSDGLRRVKQLTGYVGGEGDEPTDNVGEYVGATGYEALIANGVDIRGTTGTKGWAPSFAVVADGNRRVMQLTGYVGGEGDEPTDNVGQYVATAGYDADIADGVDLRGPIGFFGFKYLWSTGTSGDPTSGYIGTNNGTFASVTNLRVSETDNDGNALAAFLATLDDSSSTTPRATIYLIKENEPTSFLMLGITSNITDSGGYDSWTVSHLGSGGSFSSGDVIRVVCIRNGNIGTTGATGTHAGPTFTYSTTTTDGDPGTGTFRFQTTTMASVNQMFIDLLNSASGDVTAWIDSWDDSTSTIKGYLHFQGVSSTSKGAIFQVTSWTTATGYRKIGLTYVAHWGTWANSDTYAVNFVRAGDKGDAGAITGPGSWVDDRIITANGTGGDVVQDGGKTIAEVLARANHTGEQAISTITDLQDELDLKADLASPIFSGAVTIITTVNGVLIQSNDAGATGPQFQTFHNSGSPAANDVIGAWFAYGKDSGGNNTAYGSIGARISDTTDGSEDGIWNISVMIAGTMTNVITIGPTSTVFVNDVSVPDEAYGAGWNASLEVPTKNAVYDQMELKAPLASPALTGTPTAPTAPANTNTTQIATTAYVQQELADLLNSAPGALDTLDELAAALGDDANFAASMASALALKAPLASPTFTGTVTVPDASFGLGKLANVATARILGRNTGGSGAIEELTAANAKTVLALVKADVGLGNVDNTSDANKPVSTATQTALDLKANLASPALTGTVAVTTTTADLSITLINTNASNLGVQTYCYHNSASPAADDYIWANYAYGNDNAGNSALYSSDFVQIVDTTNGSEDGKRVFSVMIAGTSTPVMTLAATVTFGVDVVVPAETYGAGWNGSNEAPTKNDLYDKIETLFTDPIITGTAREDVYTISDGAGFAIDPRNGSIQLITLGASRTPVAANFNAGDSVTLMIADGSAYTITWSTVAVTWVGGVAPTLATTGYTIVELWKVGSTIYGSSPGAVA